MTARRLSAVALAALLALPAPAWARYTISCSSSGYRYQYCGAGTDGYARLLNQTSNSPCIQGRTWGYDNGGVWVNNGCSGNFEVGGGSNSGGGAAVAAGVGLAILGAIIANSDRDDDNNNYYPQRPYPPQPYPPPYPPSYPGGAVPGWAIGSFSGTDATGAQQTIQINPDGAVTIRNRSNRTERGWYNGDTLNLGNRAMRVQPIARGGIAVDGMAFYRR
jgi:hypothetical protein